ncbi:penicillin-binding protein [Halobacillus andaensis]|uniref:serine-type D-Ala-D-Ala carboxypeptidase n=1 Tax=Halobacillus andaensis TaxID=1176239 RepID=A0A917B075_HALAA|nr:penicillin-binding protein 2 [Halobacillus andaensis]MBP2003081.1 cell division protein FtsI/penicillin-binding protein 2 [Halobacillus andaensis]GGF07849.1 penicillin-binding protein [Halobacillus andaensis]
MGKNSNHKKSHLPFRLNIIFFIVFLLFAGLILQLGVVQILTGESAQEEIDRTENTTTTIPVPRGEMYDRYGRVMVNNEPLYSITYTPPKGVQAEDRLEVAEAMAQYIKMDFEDELTDRDLREYFFLKNEQEVTERLSEEDLEDLDNGEVYQAQIDSITEEEINDFDDETKEIIAIKKELDKAYTLSPHVVKNADISQEEYSTVAEHLSELPGVNVTSDWERDFPYDNTFRSFIGGITTSEQGIPRDEEDYYMSLDYSRNDRVGTSGLEEQYESVLRGTKEKVQYTTDKNNTVIDTEVVREGSRGKDLMLSLDVELQQEVDDIVEEELVKAIEEEPQANRHMENAIVVMSDPNNGEVLAVSGKEYNRDREPGDDKVSDASYQAVYNAYMPGSTVKGATVLTGLEEGVITPGTVVNDRTLRFQSSPNKSSYRPGIGNVNYRQALQQSSNVYMFYIAMWMGGHEYVENSTLNLQSDTLQRFNYHFNQFGLGVETGIDFPYEAKGFEEMNFPNPGVVLDYSIGQYSTYTAMQLNQYVSTIANGGNRVRPKLVKEVHNPNEEEEGLGPLYNKYDTEVMNRLTMDETDITRVQEAFRDVFRPGGTAYSYFDDAEYQVAGKTGTAQESKFVQNDNGTTERYDTLNLTMVGYAPYENPEVAFSVMVPYTGTDSDTSINGVISRRIMDAYFDLKEEREENGINLELTDADEKVEEVEEE